MTHETPKFVKSLVEGWPVYAAVGAFLLLYSELWIDRRVDNRITLAHDALPSLTALDKKVGENGVTLGSLTAGQLRIEGQLNLLTEHLLDE
jgi:hypothetical protein